jgi:hypothetical protein
MTVYPLSSIDFYIIQDGLKIKSNFRISVRSLIPRETLSGMPKAMNPFDDRVLGEDAGRNIDQGGGGNGRGAKNPYQY